MSSPALPRHRPSPAADRSRTVDRRPAASPAGRYRYDRLTGSWWWSADMCRLLGVDASTVPSTEALVAVHHPDDASRLRLAIAGAVDRGRPFAIQTRVMHPGRGQRTVVLLGEPTRDASGMVRGLDGVCADISSTRPAEPGGDRSLELQAEVSQMRAAMSSRAVIEQAKGILMLLTSCGEQVAFELLTHISSHTHRKVRDVAQSLTESATGGTPLPRDVAAILRDACPPGRPLR